MCDHGRLNYRWMNRQDRVEVAAGAPRRRRSRRPTGTSRCREPPRLLAGKRAFVLASPICRTRRCTCSSRLVKKTGGAGAFRVPQGAGGAAAGRRGSRAPRGSRARTARGAELLGFTRSETPLSALERRRRAHRRRRGAGAASTPRTSAKAGAVIVIGTTLPAWARHARRRRAADRELRRGGRHVHEPARPRAALPAGQGGARHGPAELVRAGRPARRVRRPARTC